MPCALCTVCRVPVRTHTIDLSTNYRRENYHRPVSSMHRRPCKYEKFFHTDNNVETGIDDFVVSRTLTLSLSLKLSTKKNRMKWNVAPSTSIMRRPQIIARDRNSGKLTVIGNGASACTEDEIQRIHFRKFDRIWRPKTPHSSYVQCSG